MIDIHVIVIDSTDQKWLDICLNSLIHPDVNVFIVDGNNNHIGQSREKGYKMGSSPFIAHVDPDDYLVEGAIDRIIPHLEKHNAITTREIVIDVNGNDLKRDRLGHQLTVYKRELVTPMLMHCMSKTEYTSEMFVKQAIQPDIVNVLTYAYRVRNDGAHTKHSPQLLKERMQWTNAVAEWYEMNK